MAEGAKIVLVESGISKRASLKSPFAPLRLQSWDVTSPDRAPKQFFEQFQQPAMPNTPSAKKDLRQSQKRRAQNRSKRSTLRTVVKKCRDAATGGDSQIAAEAFRQATKHLDQAAAKHLIHKKAAARTKSRLSKMLRVQAGSDS